MRVFSLVSLLLLIQSVCAQGDFLTLKDGAKLYVEDQGQGQTLVFIPGWTMTHRFFENQKSYFTGNFRVLSYDPRGHGRSDKTTFKNTYSDHSQDLKQILTQKNLNDVVLIGWSSGCLTIYEYLRNFGTEGVEKLVLIDEPPKWIGDRQTEWVYADFDGYRSSLKDLIAGPSEPDGIIDWMLKDPVDSLTRQWMKDEILLTAPHVALSLYVDGIISDYQEEVRKMTSEVPTLFMLRDSWYVEGKTWLEKNAPNAKTQSISSHAMFWEKPEAFNRMLFDFLK